MLVGVVASRELCHGIPVESMIRYFVLIDQSSSPVVEFALEIHNCGGAQANCLSNFWLKFISLLYVRVIQNLCYRRFFVDMDGGIPERPKGKGCSEWDSPFLQPETKIVPILLPGKYH